MFAQLFDVPNLVGLTSVLVTSVVVSILAGPASSSVATPGVVAVSASTVRSRIWSSHDRVLFREY